MIKNFLNPEGHQNPISGSKVTAGGWIDARCTDAVMHGVLMQWCTVHSWTPGSGLVSPRTSPATTSSWSSEEFPTNIFGGKRPPNQRPGSDHVTWGPMRGLEKNRMGRGQHATQSWTRWLTDQLGPEGPSWWKSRIRETLNLSIDADSRTDTILEKLHDF